MSPTLSTTPQSDDANHTHCMQACLQVFASQPEAIALLHNATPIHYAQLSSLCTSSIEYFQQLGVQPKQRVLLLSDQPLVQIIVYHALMIMGCPVVLHPPMHAHHVWCFLRGDIQPSWAISQYDITQQAWTQTPLCYDLRSELPHTHDLPPMEALPAPQQTLSQHLHTGTLASDLATIIYTSGSTGKPKGVMLSHRNIMAARTAIQSYLHLQPHDRVLSSLPFWFDYGLYQSLLCFNVGATLIPCPATLNPYRLYAMTHEQHVSVLPITPNTVNLLQTLTQSHRLPTAAKVTTITTTGAALHAHHVRTLQRLFPRAKIYAMYGLTECKRCAYVNPDTLNKLADNAPMPLGQAIPNTRMYLANHLHQAVAQGTQGQILIEGEHVMMGYWRRAKATKRALRLNPITGNMALHTGDWAFESTDGHLYFAGRRDDLFKCRGVRISPQTIEETVSNHCEVREICVFGIHKPHQHAGDDHEIIAYVACERSELEHIQWTCRKYLPATHQPHGWYAMDTLPKLSNGKIDRAQLRLRHAPR